MSGLETWSGKLRSPGLRSRKRCTRQKPAWYTRTAHWSILHPNNIAYRSSYPDIGFAHYIQGDRDAAEQAYKEALSLAQAAGDHEAF